MFAVTTINRTLGENFEGHDLVDPVLEEKLDEKDSLLMDGNVKFSLLLLHLQLLPLISPKDVSAQ